MNRRVAALLVAVVALPVIAYATPAQASDFAQQVVALTNDQRRAHGCGDLTVDPVLTAVAEAHSADMAANDYFDHDSQDGRDPGDRMSDAGYDWNSWAENIAAGYKTPKIVVEKWMASPGHRANILNCGLRDIGVGYVTASDARYSTYWTQDFGTKG